MNVASAGGLLLLQGLGAGKFSADSKSLGVAMQNCTGTRCASAASAMPRSQSGAAEALDRNAGTHS